MSANSVAYEQLQIARALRVTPSFDVGTEADQRTGFLVSCLRDSGLKALVLGISGGVDSLVAGLLAQQAVEAARRRGYDARFIAMRLPYHAQADEADAQACLDVIQPDERLTVDIGPASDDILASLERAGQQWRDASQRDFLLGNIKARQRMVVQYAVAGARAGLVVGTDHAAEALMGFFTKFGDGAADLMPLAGLNKRRVRALGLHMGAPTELVHKVPTADLETLVPLKPDETAFGVGYDDIDDFLEGREVPETSRAVILRHYRASAHKRALPVVPPVADGLAGPEAGGTT